MTLKQAAQSALDVQYACNLSGVARSLWEVCNAIREAFPNTGAVNTHPIVTMYLLKMCELNGCGSTLHESYEPAERACIALAANTPSCGATGGCMECNTPENAKGKY
jgi:hypothetical protein